MSTARSQHGSAVVHGKLYVMGGKDADNVALSSVECFDPLTNQWSAVADMGTARIRFGAAALECPAD